MLLWRLRWGAILINIGTAILAAVNIIVNIRSAMWTLHKLLSFDDVICRKYDTGLRVDSQNDFLP